ncbi:hypothetical protein CPB84DRAFT_1749519 [Gymnopilus junonius]|uniref:Uncharacterized protein n=1 Tax=Gymnopilus junonius TaxID=109634 RepID=A0A9P5TL68_GYMJU|nr:hypothetical protein CPB84DRAFT_1749519 [Gymnopilus junonius]
MASPLRVEVEFAKVALALRAIQIQQRKEGVGSRSVLQFKGKKVGQSEASIIISKVSQSATTPPFERAVCQYSEMEEPKGSLLLSVQQPIDELAEVLKVDALSIAFSFHPVGKWMRCDPINPTRSSAPDRKASMGGRDWLRRLTNCSWVAYKFQDMMSSDPKDTWSTKESKEKMRRETVVVKVDKWCATESSVLEVVTYELSRTDPGAERLGDPRDSKIEPTTSI